MTSESGISSGVRRIEAVTGFGALQWVDDTDRTLREAAKLVRGSRESMIEKIQQTLDRNRQLEKDLDALKAKLASSAGSDLAASAVEVGGLKVVATEMEGADRKALMETADQLKNKLGDGVVVLASVDGDKVSLVAGVTQDLTGKIKAGDLVNRVAQQVGGKGGGRPDMAMAGGTEPAALPAALKSVSVFVTQFT
jgi:alanyl-tRNA synthetase